jgi:excisionase family DNA binding protein
VTETTAHLVDRRAEYPPVLTTALAAELLQLHAESLRRMVREGRVPCHRLGGGRDMRFLRDELLAWLAEQPGATGARDVSAATERAPSAPR